MSKLQQRTLYYWGINAPIEVPSSDFAGISTDTEVAPLLFIPWRVG